MSRIKSFLSFANDQLIYVVLLAFLFIFPLVFIPTPYISGSFIKIGVLSITVTATIAMWFFNVLKRGSIEGQSRWFLLALCVVPVAVLISTFLGIDKSNGIYGIGSSVLSFYFVVLGALLVYVVSTTFRSKDRMFFGYVAILASAAVIFIFHTIRFFTGPEFMSFGLFTSGGSNTIGSWNDMGIFVASVVLITCATLEYLPLARVWKILLWIMLVLGLLLLAGTNFFVIVFASGGGIYLSFFVGISSLAICAHVFARGRDTEGGKRKRIFPAASFLVMIVCSIFTMGAGTISQYVYKSAGINQQDVLDVRMSQKTTFDLAISTYKSGISGTLFGSGPARLETVWNLHKPQSVNTTVFWDGEASYASGYISTFFITSGLMGLFAILYLFGYTILIAYKYFKEKSDDQYAFYFGLTSFGAATLIWGSSLFYVPNVTTIVLGCFMLGLFYSGAIREGIIASSERVLPTMGGRGMGIAAISMISIILVIGSFYTWTERVSASMKATQAVSLYRINASNSEIAKDLLVQAITKYPADIYLRALATINLEDVARTITDKNRQISVDNLSDANKASLAQAVNLGESAVLFNPYSYQNHLSLGNTYEILIPIIGVDYAIAARDQYLAAKQLNPSSPIPNGNLARIYYKASEFSAAEAEILDALQKKPDMTALNSDLTEIRNAMKRGGASEKKVNSVSGTSTRNTIKK